MPCKPARRACHKKGINKSKKKQKKKLIREERKHLFNIQIEYEMNARSCCK